MRGERSRAHCESSNHLFHRVNDCWKSTKTTPIHSLNSLGKHKPTTLDEHKRDLLKTRFDGNVGVYSSNPTDRMKVSPKVISERSPCHLPLIVSHNPDPVDNHMRLHSSAHRVHRPKEYRIARHPTEAHQVVWDLRRAFIEFKND